MRTNASRRTALLDAAINVLAEQGARGLTFRAVDTAAAVPPGTASNYFTSRNELLGQAASRVYERFQPDAEALAHSLSEPVDRETIATAMREAVHRITGFRSEYLALLELRLEATRHPEMQATITRRARDDIAANVAAHEAAHRPGDATSVRLLHMALNWLIVERLTLPGVYTEQEADELVDHAVERLI